MPQPTFFNLTKEKQEFILAAAIDEFGQSSYHAASINQVCQKAHIAKGSFYQYFSDKLDLYVYVMTIGIEKKITFFQSVLAEFHTLTLKEQIRLLFTKGVEFAGAYPHFAALGEQFAKETDEKVTAAVMDVGNEESESIFLQMVAHAKSKGELKDEVDPHALSLLLQSLNQTVNDYMLNSFGNVAYSDNLDEMNTFVDSLLTIVFHGIEN